MLFHTLYPQIIRKEHVETWFFKNQDWKLAFHDEIKLGPGPGHPSQMIQPHFGGVLEGPGCHAPIHPLIHSVSFP